MYEILFRNPDIRDLFNQSHHGETGSQSKALTPAVIAYARNIDNLGVLGTRVERIVQKHVGLNILPEHYTSWRMRCSQPSRTCSGTPRRPRSVPLGARRNGSSRTCSIPREATIYSGLAATPGGWNGWREFVIERSSQKAR